MTDIKTSSPSEINPPSDQAPYGYGGFWRRLYANIIDGFIISVISGPLAYTTTVAAGKTASTSTSSLSFIVGIIYVVFFWVSQNGQTLGKRLMGVRVVREDGNPLDYGTAVVRYIGYILSSIFMLGYISAAFDRRKQGWHDKLAHTLVVRIDNNARNGRMIIMGILTFLIPIVLAVFFFIGLAIGLSGLKTLKNTDSLTNSSKLPTSLEKYVPTRSLSESQNLENTVFAGINSDRLISKLPTLILDNRLCAYAQRRLDQVKTLGKYDDARGLYEDMADNSIVKAYFTQYQNIGENYYPLNSLTSSTDIIDSWKNTTNLLESKYSYGCVRADNSAVFLVLGQRLK